MQERFVTRFDPVPVTIDLRDQAAPAIPESDEIQSLAG